MSNNSLRNALSTQREKKSDLESADGRDLRALVTQQRSGIEAALAGTALNAERFTRIALTILKKTPKLLECRSDTFLGALMTSAQLGLEPGPLGEAHLVPYGDVCTFVPGYRGLIKLAWNSGQLRHIDADVVLDGEEFDYAKGTEPFLRHKPGGSERHTKDGVTHVYAVASMTNGGNAFTVLNIKEVERIRRTYAKGLGKKDHPWNTEWAEMAKKTALRRLAKVLPMSASVNLALNLEGSVRNSLDTSVEEVAATIDGEVVPNDEIDWQAAIDAASNDTTALQKLFEHAKDAGADRDVLHQIHTAMQNSRNPENQ